MLSSEVSAQLWRALLIPWGLSSSPWDTWCHTYLSVSDIPCESFFWGTRSQIDFQPNPWVYLRSGSDPPVLRHCCQPSTAKLSRAWVTWSLATADVDQKRWNEPVKQQTYSCCCYSGAEHWIPAPGYLVPFGNIQPIENKSCSEFSSHLHHFQSWHFGRV